MDEFIEQIMVISNKKRRKEEEQPDESVKRNSDVNALRKVFRLGVADKIFYWNLRIILLILPEST